MSQITDVERFLPPKVVPTLSTNDGAGEYSAELYRCDGGLHPAQVTQEMPLGEDKP